MAKKCLKYVMKKHWKIERLIINVTLIIVKKKHFFTFQKNTKKLPMKDIYKTMIYNDNDL